MAHIWIPNNKFSATHGARLERWLGAQAVNELSFLMKNWYGRPIATLVPGAVYVTPGGDFIGPITGGAGFASLSDLIAEASAGKRREFQWQKSFPTPGAANLTMSAWGVADTPPAGANASAAPGGDAPTDATQGAPFFTNPTGGDTQHIVAGSTVSSVAGKNILLYDRIFQVNKTMNSTATEAVTGVPARYQSVTSGAVDSAEGNFLFVEVGGTALAATAHNWTVCTYKDQGDAASTLPSLAGVSGAVVRRLDHPAGQWFAPLETGDRGIKALTQMQCDALVATGVINFVIGHPLAWMSTPTASILYMFDYINTSFNLGRVFDDAALALLSPLSTSAAFSSIVSLTTVAG